MLGLYEGEVRRPRSPARRGRRRQGRVQVALGGLPAERPAGPGRRPRQARGRRRRARCGSPPRSPPRRRAARGELAGLGRCRSSTTPRPRAEALVTGTILGAYRFDRFRAADPEEPEPAGARVADAARDRRASPPRPRPRASTPRPRTGPATCRAPPPTSPPRASSPSAPSEIAAGYGRGQRRGPRPRGDRRARAWAAWLAVSPGRRRGAAADRPPLRRRRRRPDPGPGRQGRHLRHRRDLAEARRRHAGDEVRHVGRRGGARGGRGDRRARPRRSTSSRSSPRPRTCPPARRSSPAT